MKKKFKKTKRYKQIRNILIVIIILVIIGFVIRLSQNYKRNRNEITNVIIDNIDITEQLEKQILIEQEQIYFSIDDIQNIFDKNLYYGKDEKEIITSSDMHTAYINLETDKMDLNGVEIDLNEEAILVDNTLYLEINGLEKVYNIDVKYNYEMNILIIENLNKEKTKCNVNKNISVRIEPTIFSNTIEKLNKGESVTAIENVENGWTRVITDSGNVGYIKTNNIENEYKVRENMEKDIISYDNYEWKEIQIEEVTEFEDLNIRKIWIETQIEYILINEKDGMCFNLENAKTEDKELLLRVIIEIAPYLREIGKKSAVINNSIIDNQELLKIVDVVI